MRLVPQLATILLTRFPLCPLHLFEARPVPSLARVEFRRSALPSMMSEEREALETEERALKEALERLQATASRGSNLLAQRAT